MHENENIETPNGSELSVQYHPISVHIEEKWLKEVVSQYGNRSRLDPKHGITAMTNFSPKTGTSTKEKEKKDIDKKEFLDLFCSRHLST